MKTQHAVLMEDPEFRRLLSVEALVAEASEAIAKLMDEQNISKADLARRLNKSRAWVTQLLSGSANMTVRTLAELAYALGAEVKLHAQPPSWKVSGKPLGAGHTPEAPGRKMKTPQPIHLLARQPLESSRGWWGQYNVKEHPRGVLERPLKAG
jgi:transcriptional regulator with XRE-family HTH domain